MRQCPGACAKGMGVLGTCVCVRVCVHACVCVFVVFPLPRVANRR